MRAVSVPGAMAAERTKASRTDRNGNDQPRAGMGKKKMSTSKDRIGAASAGELSARPRETVAVLAWRCRGVDEVSHLRSTTTGIRAILTRAASPLACITDSCFRAIQTGIDGFFQEAVVFFRRGPAGKVHGGLLQRKSYFVPRWR
jgi:hypothetical protein